MPRLLSIARIVFGLCIAFFGVEYLLHGRFVSGLAPAPPWTPGAPALAWLLGAVLLLAGIGTATLHRRLALPCALTIGIVCFASVLFLYGMHAYDISRDGSVRTGAFEALAIAGAAFALAGDLRRFAIPLRLLGQILFALSLLVFAQLHFQFAAFVASLIPAWIPEHLFFAWFTGFCFLAAAVAIAANRLRTLAALLNGLMFLLWFLLLHIPRVVAAPKNTDELVSAIVALTLAAGSVAVAVPRSPSDPALS